MSRAYKIVILGRTIFQQRQQESTAKLSDFYVSSDSSDSSNPSNPSTKIGAIKYKPLDEMVKNLVDKYYSNTEIKTIKIYFYDIQERQATISFQNINRITGVLTKMEWIGIQGTFENLPQTLLKHNINEIDFIIFDYSTFKFFPNDINILIEAIHLNPSAKVLIPESRPVSPTFRMMNEENLMTAQMEKLDINGNTPFINVKMLDGKECYVKIPTLEMSFQKFRTHLFWSVFEEIIRNNQMEIDKKEIQSEPGSPNSESNNSESNNSESPNLIDLDPIKLNQEITTMRFIFAGKELKDDKTLLDYNLYSSSTIHAVITLGRRLKYSEVEILESKNIQVIENLEEYPLYHPVLDDLYRSQPNQKAYICLES